VIRPIAVTLAVLLPSAARAECIQLEGDADRIAEVAQLLTERGIDFSITEGRCTSLRARLELRGAKLAVHLDDREGRESEREVSDERIAATLIESWTRSDLAEPLYQAKPLERRPILRPEPKDDLAPPEVVEEHTRFELSAIAQAAIDQDASNWYGALVRARLGETELQPSVSARVLQGASHRSSTLASPASRLSIEVIAGADTAIDLGAFALRPGAGLGLGLVHTARGAIDTSGAELQPIIADGFSRSGFGPRAEVHLAASTRIGRALSIELDVSGSIAPLAHRDPIVPEYAAALESRDRTKLSLAAEPLFIAHAGLGFRWEAR
jgi:hypothetical protein